jgi:ATP-dependent Lon protease
LPLLPRRRGILFPNTSGPILVGRKTSLRAVDDATAAEGIVAVVTQRDPSMSDLAVDDVFPIATESVVNRALRLPDGTTQVWVQGLRRLRVLGFAATEPCYRVIVEPVEEDNDTTIQTEALRRAVLALFEKVCKMAPSVPEDAYVMALNIEGVGAFADYVASCLNLDDFEAEDLLSTLESRERLEKLSIHLAKELDVLELQTKIHSRVQEELDRSQREYFLREQMKAIQKELGEGDDQTKEIEELAEKIEAVGMPDPVKKEALRELDRLSKMPAAAAEYTVSRTYLDWLVALP